MRAGDARRRGIRAAAILPGGVDTPFWDEARASETPRGAMLSADDVARAVVQVLDLDAGVVIRELQIRGIRDRDFGN